MEKLIELLNKYLFEKGEKLVIKNYYNNDWLEELGWEFRWVHLKDKKYSVDFIRWEQVISKRYGFIKWLVENNKIERLTFCESWLGWKYTDFELSYDTPREDYINMLLMELAIQDEPIEFLISILK